MINVGILLDVCGITYSETQLLKLETLINNLIKKKLLEKNSSDHDPSTTSVALIKQKLFEENTFEIEYDLPSDPLEHFEENTIEIKDFPNESIENDFIEVETIFKEEQNQKINKKESIFIDQEEKETYQCSKCKQNFDENEAISLHVASTNHIKMSSDTTTTPRSITKRELLKFLHKKGSTPLKPKASSYATDVENFLLQRFRISPDSDEAGIIRAKSAKFSFAAREKWKKCRSGMIDRVLKKNTGKEPI